jgi:hypothetical protein
MAQILEQILKLLRQHNGSYSAILLDALTHGVAIPGNVQLYVAALTLISLREDFPQFLGNSIMTFVDQSVVMMKIKLVCQGGVSTQLVIRNSGAMKTSSTEHPVDYFARLCKQAIRDALIPAGARLSDGGCRLTAPNLSSDGSFWADMCPRCGWGCMDFDTHMDKGWGQFPNLGRGMWKSIITETAKEFFFMFCSEYAKFVCWVLENPFIFANRWIRRSKFLQTGCEFEMGIPSLPVIFEKEVFFNRTLLPCFAKLPTQDGDCRLVPSPFMMIVDPANHKPIDDYAKMSCFGSRRRRDEPKSKKMGPHTGMLTKVAKSLGCFGGFADSILRRVLHTPSEGILREFKDENLILTEKLMRILGHFQNEDLIQVLEILEKALHL